MRINKQIKMCISIDWNDISCIYAAHGERIDGTNAAALTTINNKTNGGCLF